MASPTTTDSPTGILPDDFLNKPSPNLTASRIDFTKTEIPQYADLYAVILDNVLSQEECDTLAAAEATAPEKGWERAMVNIGAEEVVDRLWKRIEQVSEVQDIVRLEHRPKITGAGPMNRDEVWLATRPNEQMRFLKYVGREYFRPHCDGTYERDDGSERSYMTIHLYLNDTGMLSESELDKLNTADRLKSVQSGLKGGATTFHYYNEKQRVDVEPKAGRILLFQHRFLLHSGDDVVDGTKYTMRTDLMYRLETEEERSNRSLKQKLMSRLSKAKK